MPYNTTTLGLGDISAKTWADWAWEAQDSTWGDSGLSNAPENTSGGMRWWNDDIDRVVYEWDAASKNPELWKYPIHPSINEFPIPNIDIESKQDDRNGDAEMNEDDLMELLEM